MAFFEIDRLRRTWLGPEVPGSDHRKHCAAGLLSEIGELAGQIDAARYKPAKFSHARLVSELGDCWYYLRMAAHLTGCPLPKPDNGARPANSPALTLSALAVCTAEIMRALITEESPAGDIDYAARLLSVIAAVYGIEPAQIEAENVIKLAGGHGWSPAPGPLFATKE